MKILAIDSSGLVATVALVSDGTVLAEYSVNFKMTHSQTLLPMIDEIMKMTGTEGTELDALAITKGPGSYTGLRIGSSTVKGLAFVWQKPVIAVPTVDVLAANYAGDGRIICPIMDARRGQVYSGIYRFDGRELKAVEPQKCMLLTEVIARINEIGESAVFLGDGVPVHSRTLAAEVKVPYEEAPMHRALQSAASLGFLACRYYEEGRFVSAMELVPDYLRQSQAEREREERLENQ